MCIGVGVCVGRYVAGWLGSGGVCVCVDDNYSFSSLFLSSLLSTCGNLANQQQKVPSHLKGGEWRVCFFVPPLTLSVV